MVGLIQSNKLLKQQNYIYEYGEVRNESKH